MLIFQYYSFSAKSPIAKLWNELHKILHLLERIYGRNKDTFCIYRNPQGLRTYLLEISHFRTQIIGVLLHTKCHDA